MGCLLLIRLTRQVGSRRGTLSRYRHHRFLPPTGQPAPNLHQDCFTRAEPSQALLKLASQETSSLSFCLLLLFDYKYFNSRTNYR